MKSNLNCVPQKSRSVKAPDISVIIPARNEASHIAATVSAARCGSPLEVLVVDGQSSDGTVQVARAAGAATMASLPSRGVQLRLGAMHARGEILLFLHADTQLPAGYVDLVHEELACPGVAAGAFRLKIDAPQRRFRVIETMVNARSLLFQIPYGDQAIFCHREFYLQAGGFPAWPAMEDLAFVRSVRRLGRIALAPSFVHTSARHWMVNGVLRTTLLNQVSVAAFYLGCSPERIAQWRRLMTDSAMGPSSRSFGTRQTPDYPITAGHREEEGRARSLPQDELPTDVTNKRHKTGRATLACVASLSREIATRTRRRS